MPPRLSYAQDHYGFFNGKNNSTLLPNSQFAFDQFTFPAATAIRDIDTNYCLTGLLTGITYPTGGRDSIDYEPNYVYGSVTIPPPDTTISLEADGGFRFGPVVSDTLYPQTTQSMIMYGSCTYGGDPSLVDSLHDLGIATFTILGNSGSPIFSQTVRIGSSWSFLETLEAGTTYVVSVQSSGNTVSSFFHFTYLNGTSRTAMMNQVTGGNRVKRVTSIDPVSKVNNIKRYYYGPLTSLNISSAVNMYSPRYDKLARYYVSCAADGLPDYTFNEYDYPTLYSTTQCNLYEYGGAPVSYSAVTESFGENFENGGIEHDFTQDADVDGEPIFGDFLLSAPRTSYSWLNGREIYTYAFKNGGETTLPVKKTYTHYAQDSRENNTYNAYITARNYVARATFEPPIQYQFNAYNFTLYSYLQRWMYADTVININYDINGANALTDTVVTVYGNPFHALPTQSSSTQTDFNSKLVSLFYPSDTVLTGNAETARQALISAGIINPPLVTVEKRGPDTMFVERTDYNVFPNGLVLPQLHNLKVGSNALEPRVQMYGYDNSGKVLEQGKIADAHSSYIWDYQDMYPVAQVSNAVQSDIAYTSFEADGTGNWTLGSGAVDTTGGITGRNSYNLTGTISKTGLNSGTTYIVSYWTENSSAFSIAGTISGYPVKGKTILINNNSWTLYVHKVTGQSTITLSGSGHIDELRLYPATAQMTTYTYSPLIGMTSQTDVGNRVTYYEYDGLARLKRIRDQDYNIVKTYEYQYQATGGCGSGCYILAMQTLAGSNTLSYPVGVFDVHGNLVGNAAGQSAYTSLWNSDTADARIGTLASGPDSMHFNFTLNAGQTAPAGVTGCRYFQYDLPWNVLDGVTTNNGAYVDFGDGAGMQIPKTPSDTPAVMPPNTTRVGFFDPYDQVWWFIHSYPDTSLKTITFYHNDDAKASDLDNGNNPATSLTKVRNLRGNIPQNASTIGGSCFQQASALTVAGITNWNTITSVQGFWPHCGDGVNGCENMSYAQDFMAGNRGLTTINASQAAYYQAGYRDTTFKLSRLKSGWNTYFTNLGDIEISDEHWNREDLSGLTHLSTFVLVAGNQNHSNNATGNTIIPIPAPVTDSVINQIWAGGGQNMSNGFISILTGGTGRTAASQPAVNALIAKHWTIVIDGVTQVSQ